MSFRVKIAIVAIFSVFISILSIGMYNSYFFERQIKADALQVRNASAVRFAYQINSFMNYNKDMLALLAAQPELLTNLDFSLAKDEFRGLAEQEGLRQRGQLQALLQLNSGLLYLNIYNAATVQPLLGEPYPLQYGVPLAVYQKGFAFRDWYQGVMRTKSLFVSEAYVNAQGRLVIAMSAPIFDEKQQLVSFLNGVITLEKLSEQAKNYCSERTGIRAVYLVDKAGNLLAHSQKNFLRQPGLVNIADRELVRQALTMPEGEIGSGSLLDPERGIQVDASFTKVSGLDWYAIVEEDQDVVPISLRNLQKNIWLVSVAVISIAFLVIFFGIRFATRSFMTMIRHLQTIASGNFSSRLSSNLLNSKDVIGEMARTVNYMQDCRLEIETELQAILAQAPVGICLLDLPCGKIMRVNRKYCEIFAYTEAEMLTISWEKLLHEDDKESYQKSKEQLLLGKNSTDNSKRRYLRKDGTTVWVEACCVPLGSNGNARGKKVAGSHIVIVTDITERQKMEDSLADSDERYRALLQKSSDRIVLVDADSKRITEPNNHWLELMGYTLAEAVQLTVYDVIADKPENIDADYERLATEGNLPASFVKLRHKSGKIIETERNGVLVRIGGKPMFLFVTRDLTEERKMQRQISRDIALAADVQKNLLPADVNDVLVTIRSVYEPYHLVSGDFFEYAWNQDHSKLGGFLLDVSGHGVASSLQGQVLSSFFREIFDSPMSMAGKLSWINRQVMRYFSDTTFAAAICFEFDFNVRTLTYATAGIHTFFTVTADLPQKVKFPGSLIGICDEPEYDQHAVNFKQGDSFYFVSDGLYEQQADWEHLVSHGFQRTIEFLRKLAVSPKRRDDCSAVCVHINDRPVFPVRLSVHRPGEYSRIRARIRSLLRCITSVDAERIEVALGEALANAARESMDVQVKMSLRRQLLMIRVKDGGKGFDGNGRIKFFRANGDETCFSNLLLAEGGRGIMIMVAWMDNVIYNRQGNEVLMVKKINKKKV